MQQGTEGAEQITKQRQSQDKVWVKDGKEVGTEGAEQITKNPK